MVLSWTEAELEADMAAGAAALALTGYEALRALLDDSGTRYEVIDGCIVVSPPAELRHENLGVRISAALQSAVPDDLLVVGSNYGVHYAYRDTDSFFVPDVQVVRADSPRLHNTVPPLLVVELLSPSTRWKDLGRKREVYASHGIPSYWVVQPDTGELTVLTLTDGAYVETARGTRLELDLPFPVVIDLG